MHPPPVLFSRTPEALLSLDSTLARVGGYFTILWKKDRYREIHVNQMRKLIAIVTAMVFVGLGNVLWEKIELGDLLPTAPTHNLSRNHQGATVSPLEIKAQILLKEKHATSGLLTNNDTSSKKVHYEFWHFALSPGRRAAPSFKLQPLDEKSHEIWTPQSCTRRVVCKAAHPYAQSFTHFAQVVFPCWSALQHYAGLFKFEGFMAVPKYSLNETNHPWHYQFLQSVKESGIEVVPFGKQIPLPPTNATYNARSCDWIVSINDGDKNKGWPDYKYQNGSSIPPGKVKVDNVKYFKKQEHMESFQKIVLKEEFAPIVNRSNNLLNILLLNREAASRNWLHVNETQALLDLEWNNNKTNPVLNITICPNFNNHTFLEQALEIHRADIIVSPHGAQLGNLAFIQPCTAVLELFPQSYYLGFFQGYVLAGKGISMNGYPMGRDPIEDTRSSSTFNSSIGKRFRGRKERDGPMLASPVSVAQAFPGVVKEVLECRQSLSKHESSATWKST